MYSKMPTEFFFQALDGQLYSILVESSSITLEYVRPCHQLQFCANTRNFSCISNRLYHRMSLAWRFIQDIQWLGWIILETKLNDKEVRRLILPNSAKALLYIAASTGTVPDIIYTAGSAVVTGIDSNNFMYFL